MRVAVVLLLRVVLVGYEDGRRGLKKRVRRSKGKKNEIKEK